MYPPYHALPVDLNSPEAQKVFAEFDAGLYTDFAVMPSEQRAYEIGRLLGVEDADAPSGSAGEAQPAPKSGASIPAYLKMIDGKVGGKVPVKDYQAIRKASVKNPEADSITLGKYTPTVVDGVADWTKPGPDSYIARAGDSSSYFDLGGEWDVIARKYGLNEQEMFEYFNKPVLEDIIARGKGIRFSHDPRKATNFLKSEWLYIKQQLGITERNLVEQGGYWYVKQ